MARRSMAHVLSDFRWVVLSVVGAVAAVLGWIGLARYLTHPSLGDLAFNTFKLFVFSAPTGPGLPWQLEVARLLAPLVAGYATLSALARLFSDCEVKKLVGLSSAELTFLPVERRLWVVESRSAVD